VTAGFSDILDMGFERRYDLSILGQISAAPGTARLRIEVERALRRQHRDGSTKPVQAAAERFKELGVAAVAVCFLHAYANPAQRRAAQILREVAPELSCPPRLTCSQYARVRALTTTTVNALRNPCRTATSSG
jgi:N-methylhydantoinase A/oxoprolinase/acetone carboxylase beta subunit